MADQMYHVVVLVSCRSACLPLKVDRPTKKNGPTQKMGPDGPKWGQGDFFLLIQTLPTFWATRILILRIFSLGIFWDPSLGPAWARLGPCLGPAWAQLGPSLGPAWTQLGPTLGPTWAQLGPTLGPA